MEGPAARDAGLVRAIGARGLAANVVNIIVGGGVFIIPASMAGAVGADALWVYLGCAAAMGAITLAFAEASSRAPSSGGPYGFVTAALGPFWGYLAGALNWASVVIAAGGIAAAAADTLAAWMPALTAGPARWALIVGWFALLAAVNIGGVRGAARVVEAAAAVKLMPLAVFVAAGLLAPPAAVPLTAGTAEGGGLAAAAILGIFLFTGMEGALGVSGEVRDPARSIPRALVAALVVVSALFIAVQLVAERALGAALATSATPLADALAGVSPPLAAAMVGAAALSMALWLASDALSAPRTLFALARDGVLPPALGRLHPRTRAPAAAIVLHVGIAAALALTGGFTRLAIISTLVVVAVYVLGCVAAVTLRRRGAALAGPPVTIPGMPAAAALGIAAMAWLTAQAKPLEAAAVAGLIAALSLLWLRRRPVPAAAMAG